MNVRIRIAALAILAGVGLWASGLTAGEKESRVDIRGTIKKLSASTAKGTLGSMMVDGKKEKDTGYDKASVRILAATKIFKLDGKDRKPADFKDLKEGQRVEARFTGPVAESYPVQATASEIVILPDGKK